MHAPLLTPSDWRERIKAKDAEIITNFHFHPFPLTTRTYRTMKARIRSLANLVRSRDSDNFYPSLFYPDHLRPTYYAIRALNQELASIDTSNPLVGRIKFDWWRQSIKSTLAVGYSALPRPSRH